MSSNNKLGLFFFYDENFFLDVEDKFKRANFGGN